MEIKSINNSQPNLSILTIAKSNINELERTYESLKYFLKRDHDLIEWILILAGDFENFPKKILDIHSNVKVIKQTPKGIYHAMNTAIRISNSKFSWFLNGGDTINKSNFNNVLDTLKKSNFDLNFFSVIIKNNYGRNEIKSCSIRNKKKLLFKLSMLRMPAHHQGIVYKSSILKKYLFNTSYKIRGDYENLIRMLLLKKDLVINSNNCSIAVFHEGGVSNISFIHLESLKALKENNYLKFHSLIIFFYYLIRYKLIKALEKLVLKNS